MGERRASYETIYRDLDDRFEGDSLFAFFNQHEKDVCRRRGYDLAKHLAEEAIHATNGRLKTGRDIAFATAHTYARSIALVIGTEALQEFHLTIPGWTTRLLNMALKGAKDGRNAEVICASLLQEIAMPQLYVEEDGEG